MANETQRAFLLLGLILPIALLCSVQSLAAELIECDGVWTNKPCEGARHGSIVESQRLPRAQSEIDLDRKKLLIHDLEIQAISARRDFGLETGFSAERTLCLSQDASVAQCEAAVDAKRKEIEERNLAAVELKAAQSRLSSNRQDAETPGIEKPAVVTIIQESSVQHDHRHRHQKDSLKDRVTPPRGASVSESAPFRDSPPRAVDRLPSATE